MLGARYSYVLQLFVCTVHNTNNYSALHFIILSSTDTFIILMPLFNYGVLLNPTNLSTIISHAPILTTSHAPSRIHNYHPSLPFTSINNMYQDLIAYLLMVPTCMPYAIYDHHPHVPITIEYKPTYLPTPHDMSPYLT